MKKRRSTVYVRPGKDVTLYIPTDTPPEVIDYLNSLKMDGYFSQGVMEIVTMYVRRQRSLPFPDAAGSVEVEEYGSFVHDSKLPDTVPFTAPEPEKDSRLQVAQIFKQARYNSGKLIDSRETTGLMNSDES